VRLLSLRDMGLVYRIDLLKTGVRSEGGGKIFIFASRKESNDVSSTQTDAVLGLQTWLCLG